MPQSCISSVKRPVIVNHKTVQSTGQNSDLPVEYLTEFPGIEQSSTTNTNKVNPGNHGDQGVLEDESPIGAMSTVAT